MSTTFWILLTACLVGASCGSIGCFLVLRRMVMMGDAISHAVLPGIACAYLLSGSRNPLPMLAGAAGAGVSTAWLSELIHKNGRVEPGAAMGVVFTLFFAIGVILVSGFAGNVDLDTDCVLYGEIAYVAWDTWTWGGVDLGPRAVWMLGTALLIDLAFVTVCYRGLKICAFDAELARSLGFRVGLYHYLLMAATSLTAVAAFESVGAILVVAMFVVPPATAYLLTDRLPIMLGLSMGIGCLSAFSGFYAAGLVDCSVSGAMTVCGGAFFVLAALFSPSQGVVTRRILRKRGAIAGDSAEWAESA